MTLRVATNCKIKIDCVLLQMAANCNTALIRAPKILLCVFHVNAQVLSILLMEVDKIFIELVFVNLTKALNSVRCAKILDIKLENQTKKSCEL